MHSPSRSGRIIEACVALHNCAKVGEVKLYKDFGMTDCFTRIQPRVVQPDQAGQKPKQKFHNMRSTFVKSWFAK